MALYFLTRARLNARPFTIASGLGFIPSWSEWTPPEKRISDPNQNRSKRQPQP